MCWIVELTKEEAREFCQKAVIGKETSGGGQPVGFGLGIPWRSLGCRRGIPSTTESNKISAR